MKMADYSIMPAEARTLIKAIMKLDISSLTGS